MKEIILMIGILILGLMATNVWAGDYWILWQRIGEGDYHSLGGYKTLEECRNDMFEEYIPAPWGKKKILNCFVNESSKSRAILICNPRDKKEYKDSKEVWLEYQCLPDTIDLRKNGETK